MTTTETKAPLMECPHHPRWTHRCEFCEEVGKNRRWLRITSFAATVDDKKWIVDPNLT